MPAPSDSDLGSSVAPRHGGGAGTTRAAIVTPYPRRIVTATVNLGHTLPPARGRRAIRTAMGEPDSNGASPSGCLLHTHD